MTPQQAIIRIQRLRRNLEVLVALRGKLTDREVLEASNKLDAAVNTYYRVLLRKSMKKQRLIH